MSAEQTDGMPLWATLDPDFVYAVAMPVFALSMLAEWALSRSRTDLRGYTPKDTAASITMGLGFLVLDTLWRALIFLPVFGALATHPLFDLWSLLPPWAAALVLLAADDLCFYAYHRAGHHIRLFWAAHHTHHSSEHYNLSTALRQSWAELFYGPLFWLPLPLLGVPVEAIVLQQAISLLYQFGLHTELVGRSGPLGWVFNTASHHRVHHGRNPRYLDRNFAGIFIVWDRLFGTFCAEDEAVDYGTVKPLRSHHPLRIAGDEPRALLRDMRAAGSVVGALRVLFGPPAAAAPQTSGTPSTQS